MQITWKIGIVGEKSLCTAQSPTRAHSSSGNLPHFIAEGPIYFIACVLTHMLLSRLENVFPSQHLDSAQS